MSVDWYGALEACHPDGRSFPARLLRTDSDMDGEFCRYVRFNRGEFWANEDGEISPTDWFIRNDAPETLTAEPEVSLRDQFAMAALASIENRTPPDFVAKRVYAIADAMLAERNK